MADEPTPEIVLKLLRTTVKINRALLTSVPQFDEASVDLLEKKIKRFHSAPEGKQRKLDAPGVLNLYGACMKAAQNTR